MWASGLLIVLKKAFCPWQTNILAVYIEIKVLETKTVPDELYDEMQKTTKKLQSKENAATLQLVNLIEYV